MNSLIPVCVARIAAGVLSGGLMNVVAAETLDEIIAQHTAAMGGAAVIEAVSSLETEIEIVEPAFSVTGHYVADRAGRMRIDVYANDQRVFTESHDGKSSWQMGGDGIPDSHDAVGTAALWHGTQFPGKVLGLHEMGNFGHVLSVQGRETVGGVDYHVLKLTFRDGFETYLYVDPQSWLITRTRDVRALHPDTDPTGLWLETRYTDFRPVDGVMRSFADSQVDLKDGTVLQNSTVNWIRTNVPLDDALFEAGAQRTD